MPPTRPADPELNRRPITFRRRPPVDPGNLAVAVTPADLARGRFGVPYAHPLSFALKRVLAEPGLTVRVVPARADGTAYAVAVRRRSGETMTAALTAPADVAFAAGRGAAPAAVVTLRFVRSAPARPHFGRQGVLRGT